LINSETE